jgi:predicted nucleic acid-binding protein
MEHAFWDLSSIVPICVKEPKTANALKLARKFGVTVWWATPLEVRSAFARTLRLGQIVSKDQAQALVVLDTLRRTWREILPDSEIRQRAEDLVERFPLTAADALQLGAAWLWCNGHPHNRKFVSSDVRLLESASQLGFDGIAT